MEATINEKAQIAIERYLERRGFEILERNWAHGSDEVDFIADEDGDLVFINSSVSTNAHEGFTEEKVDREAFERLAMAYLSEHLDGPDMTVRFDIVSLVVVGEDRDLLRHHRNVLSAL